MNRSIGKGLPTSGSSLLSLMLKFTGELATLEGVKLGKLIHNSRVSNV